MKNFVKNRYLDALLKTILASAITHLILLYSLALINRDFEIVNMFNIFDFDLIWPDIAIGSNNFFFSYIALGVLYAVIYFLFTSSKPKK